jgi:hypothetical protein
MLTLKILQNLKNECSENIINFFSSLSDFGDEYFRLVCLYEIDISSWECSPPLFEISTSFSNIDESFDYWFKNIDIESCKNYVESINIDHLNNVKNILQYSISYTKKSYRHKEINRPIERKDIDSSYCPRCNEDPCMCSDPDI